MFFFPPFRLKYLYKYNIFTHNLIFDRNKLRVRVKMIARQTKYKMRDMDISQARSTKNDKYIFITYILCECMHTYVYVCDSHKNPI